LSPHEEGRRPTAVTRQFLMAFVRKGTHAIPTPTVLVQEPRGSFLSEYVHQMKLTAKKFMTTRRSLTARAKNLLNNFGNAHSRCHVAGLPCQVFNLSRRLLVCVGYNVALSSPTLSRLPDLCCSRECTNNCHEKSPIYTLCPSPHTVQRPFGHFGNELTSDH